MTEVPQIYQETGISGDYTNEYTGNLMGWSLDGFSSLANLFQVYHMRTYRQRFSPGLYDKVVTEQNRQAIQRLDEIAQELNYKMPRQEISPEEFIARINELQHLIIGNKARTYTLEDWELQRK